MAVTVALWQISFSNLLKISATFSLNAEWMQNRVLWIATECKYWQSNVFVFFLLFQFYSMELINFLLKDSFFLLSFVCVTNHYTDKLASNWFTLHCSWSSAKGLFDKLHDKITREVKERVLKSCWLQFENLWLSLSKYHHELYYHFSRTRNDKIR